MTQRIVHGSLNYSFEYRRLCCGGRAGGGLPAQGPAGDYRTRRCGPGGCLRYERRGLSQRYPQRHGPAPGRAPVSGRQDPGAPSRPLRTGHALSAQADPAVFTPYRNRRGRRAFVYGCFRHRPPFRSPHGCRLAAAAAGQKRPGPGSDLVGGPQQTGGQSGHTPGQT